MKIRDALVVERLGVVGESRDGIVEGADVRPQAHRPLQHLARYPADLPARRVRVVLGERGRTGKAEDEGGRRQGPPGGKRHRRGPPRGVDERNTGYDTASRLHSAPDGVIFLSTSGETRVSGPGNLGGQPKVPS